MSIKGHRGRARRPVRSLLFVVLAAVVLTACNGSVPRVSLEGPTDFEEFMYVVALNFKEPSLCEKIRPLVDGGGGGWAPEGQQIQALRSKCYGSLATTLHDIALCDHVYAVRTDTLDGSELNQANCVKHGGGEVDIAVPHPTFMQPTVRLMRSMGYGDREVAEGRYAENPESSEAYAAYERLRDDTAFRDRVKAAPSYAEPRSKERIRPANPAEFLYQMIGVDLGDPQFCAKVSPNATFTDTSPQTALLYSRCNLHIAFNTRNLAACDPLPRAASFPFVDNRYDSREHCREDVAIYRRTVKDNLRYGPSPFPHAADFDAALRQIGWTSGHVPTVTPDDYWQYLAGLSRESGPEAQEFVRRAMQLKP